MARGVYVGADDFEQRGLPEGYTQIEYVGASGSQHIDTGVLGESGLVVKGCISPGKVGASIPIGCYNPSRCYMFSLTDTNAVRYGYIDWVTCDKVLSVDEWYEFEIDFSAGAQKLKINGEVVASSSKTGTIANTHTIYLFAYNDGGSAGDFFNGRFKYLQFYKNGELIRDYVACKTGSGEVGFYDFVTGDLFGNDGYGALIGGLESRDSIARNVKKMYLSPAEKKAVLPEGYTKLDYIQSNGAQYIDTLCKWTSEKTKVEIGFEYTGTPNAVSLFGSEVSGAQYSGVPWGDSANSFQIFIGTSKSLLQTSVLMDAHYDLALSTDSGVVSINLNGVEQSSAYSGSVQNGTNIMIFANNVSGAASQKSSLKLKYCRMYQDDALILNFIPVLDGDGVACLYDFASNACFYNAGEGSFFYTEKRQLPEGYVQLYYIQSDGAQYVNTEIAPNNNTRVVMDFQYTEATGYNFAFGTRTSSGAADRFAMMLYSVGNTLRSDYGSDVIYFDAAVNGLFRHIVDKNKSVCVIDGVSVTNAKASFSCPYPIYLFALNNGGTAADYARVRVYSCKIYDNDVLVRDYVPCVDEAGKVGLYDAAEGKFYANAGSGSFTAVQTITGVARRVRKGFIGIGKIARPFWGEDALPTYYGAITSLSGAKSNMASERNDEYAVFAGGQSAGATSNVATVDVYNRSLVRSSATNLSVARNDAAAAMVGGTILFAGGYTNSKIGTSVVNAYDSALVMSVVTPLSGSRYSLAGARGDGHAIFAGGYETSYVDVVEAYNATMTKLMLERLPSAAYGTNGGSIDGNAVFWSGGAVVAYNKSLVQRVLEPFGFGGANARSAVAHDHLIFAAGREDMDGGKSAVAYDRSLVKKVVSDLSAKRYQCGASDLKHCAMFCGVDTSTGDLTADVYTPTLTRSLVSAEGALGVFSLGAETVGDYLLLAGGSAGGTNTVKYVHAFTIL